MNQESENILEVRDLRVWFPVKKGVFARTVGYVKAVDGVSFDLKRGETLGVVGESGCGKSTTSRSVLLLNKPCGGSVKVNGADINTVGCGSVANDAWRTSEGKAAVKKLGIKWLLATLSMLAVFCLPATPALKLYRTATGWLSCAFAFTWIAVAMLISAICFAAIVKKEFCRVFELGWFSPSGRMTREDFWQAWIPATFFTLFSFAALVAFFGAQAVPALLVLVLRMLSISAAAAFAIGAAMQFALGARRLHDLDSSALWLVVWAIFLPFTELPRLAILGFIEGKRSLNRFGPDPKDSEACKNFVPCSRKEYCRQVQVIFQDPQASLNPRHTILEILTEGMIYHGLLKKEDRRKKGEELLESVGLPADMLDRYPHEFSGGQRQRICIARAIALKPQLLICDEAVSALDLSIRAQVLDLLADLKKKLSLSFLFITHDIGVVQHFADRIIVMNKGKIVEQGPTQEVLKNPKEDYTKYLMAAVPKIGKPLI